MAYKKHERKKKLTKIRENKRIKHVLRVADICQSLESEENSNIFATPNVFQK
jgi:HD superfamily phosphodiesterase